MKEKYHHGDLPTALIQAGIELINTEGLAALSLRKVAAKCGVSHTAPYSHFADKGQLLAAMKNHVTEAFADVLLQARDRVQRQEGESEREYAYRQLRAMGVAYVDFFHKNPAYYSFLFAQPDMNVDLTDLGNESDYKPFGIFKQVALTVLYVRGAPQQALLPGVVSMWALVHGMAGMAIMPSVRYAGDWGELTEAIMQNTGIGEEHEAIDT